MRHKNNQNYCYGPFMVGMSIFWVLVVREDARLIPAIFGLQKYHNKLRIQLPNLFEVF